jgi:Glycosyl transferase family 2
MGCPSIAILIVSHNKPRLLAEAVGSVLAQTFPDWQSILIDSGLLHDQGYFRHVSWAGDPRLRIVRSPETPALRRHKSMAPWCFNECFRRGWVQAELVMYLCDDDILYPNAFATFVDAFQENPAAMAMYASQDIGWIGSDGAKEIIGERRALAPGGKCCNGRLMDCQVDYLQLCHRRAALRAFGDAEYWPEDKATQDHADGVFMEKLGTFYEILPLDIKIGQNRRTPWSINVPASTKAIASDRPVQDTIMDAWARVSSHLAKNAGSEIMLKHLADFQGQLRKLCEQDHVQRVRLISKRYWLADRLHALCAHVPGALQLAKCCARLLANGSQRH